MVANYFYFIYIYNFPEKVSENGIEHLKNQYYIKRDTDKFIGMHMYVKKLIFT